MISIIHASVDKFEVEKEKMTAQIKALQGELGEINRAMREKDNALVQVQGDNGELVYTLYTNGLPWERPTFESVNTLSPMKFKNHSHLQTSQYSF